MSYTMKHDHRTEHRQTLQHQPGNQPITRAEIAGIIASGIIGIVIAALFFFNQ